MAEVRVCILAAPEYFDNAGNNKAVWVNSLYRKFLNRSGRPDEIRFGVSELDNRHRGDRRNAARAWLVHFGRY
jgi:hypothetical protein